MPTKKQILLKKKFTSWTLCRTFILVYLLVWPLHAWAGVISLLGLVGAFGIESTYALQLADWFTGSSGTNISLGLYLLGSIIAMLIQFAAFIITAVLYVLFDTDAWKGSSLIILPLIFTLCLVPIINLFPLIWGWWVYVSVSNSHS